MEYLMNLSAMFTEITLNELLFGIVILICIAQAVILGVICGDHFKIKRKYHSLVQDFQMLQLLSHQANTQKMPENVSIYNKKEESTIYNKVETPNTEPDKEEVLYNAVFKNLQKLMEENKIYHDPRLTRDEVVAKLGTSRKTFLEALQRHINMTFTEYTNKYRLDEAVELLENGEYTNETIAEEVGFGSVNTFYRQFRQRYGISPLEYRKALNDNLVASGF